MKKATHKSQQQTGSRGIKISTWVATLLSFGILYSAVKIFANDLGGYRSCSADNTGLVLVDCGKQSFSSGDYILLGFVLASFVLFVSLGYASYQTVRNRK